MWKRDVIFDFSSLTKWCIFLNHSSSGVCFPLALCIVCECSRFIRLLLDSIKTSSRHPLSFLYLRSREKNAFKWSDLNYIEVLWVPKGEKMLIPIQSFIKWVLGRKANKSTEIPIRFRGMPHSDFSDRAVGPASSAKPLRCPVEWGFSPAL